MAALVQGQLNQAGAQTIADSPVLTGNHFDLAIGAHQVDLTGRRVKAIAVNGSSPGPTLKWREGETVTIAVTNHLPVETSIHWHGIRVPASMDGVPGLSFAGIAPGKTFVYRFPVPQNGTYWYHSHSGFQEQIGLIGALVIEPRDQEPIAYDRDYVVLLSDWSDTNPETLYGNLKKQSDYYNFHKRTAGTFIDDVRSRGLHSTVADRLSWGRMNMSPTDIADVTSATYIYLMNGHPPDANWTALFKPTERVRLRFINGSAMTIFDVRIPGLPMTVVQADGNYVQPVMVDGNPTRRRGDLRHYRSTARREGIHHLCAARIPRSLCTRYVGSADRHDGGHPAHGSIPPSHDGGYGHGQYGSNEGH
jgi:CopA family copper-resistance protein